MMPHRTTVAVLIDHPARFLPCSCVACWTYCPVGTIECREATVRPMTVAAALVVCALLAALSAFQILLVVGRPLGRFAWGGTHDVLPLHLRVGSAISIVLYGLFAVLVLDRAEIIDLLPDAVVDVGIWVLVGYLALGVLLNGMSRSRPERNVMTPTVLVLAVLTLVVALN